MKLFRFRGRGTTKVIQKMCAKTLVVAGIGRAKSSPMPRCQVVCPSSGVVAPLAYYGGVNNLITRFRSLARLLSHCVAAPDGHGTLRVRDT